MDTCCGKLFAHRRNLLRHQREQHSSEESYKCEQCGKSFPRQDKLWRHQHVHSKRVAMSPSASQMPLQPIPVISTIDINESSEYANGSIIPISSVNAQYPHQEVSGTEQIDEDEIDDPDLYPTSELQQRAMQGFLTSYRIKYTTDIVDPEFFLNYMAREATRLILTHPSRGIKLWICLVMSFEKASDPSETIEGYFCCKQRVILPGSNKLTEVEATFPEILAAIDSFEKRGSGWVIRKILHADIHFSIYQPLRGSSYKKLPLYLKNKHAIVSPQNQDDRCFMWAVLAGLHPVDRNPARIASYSIYSDELSFDGMSFPVPLSQIPRFERINKLSVNVYGYEKNIYPLYISKSSDYHIDLLLYEGHYSWVKSLDTLLYDQNLHRTRKYFCPRCLIPVYSENSRNDHLTRCGGNPTRVVMPEKAELKFSNIHRMQRQPLVVYADFECLTVPISSGTTSSHKYQNHVPCGYGLMESSGCCGNPTFSEPTIYRGLNTVRKFLLELVQIALAHQERLNNYPPIRMTDLDKQKHRSHICHICKQQIMSEKVRDHCHICGQYRGPAHNECNQALRLNRDVIVIFHNLRRYDGHLIMQGLGELCKELGFEIDVVPKGLEDYLSFSIKNSPTKDHEESTGESEEANHASEEKDHYWKLRFIDSCQFLANSLEGLVSNLDKSLCRAMESQFEGRELQLLLRKGVFPYDWLNGWEKFNQPLPQKEHFYSKLNDSHISSQDYEHAKEVWPTFSMINMGQYHDLYLKTDVLLLADVFEEFRAFCMENYKLDPAHYMTLPSFAWDACLKMTNISLELLQDPEIYTFLESGIRGGVSMISHRFAKANNPDVGHYDSTKPNSYIIYLDANNLYGWSMIQALPTDQFKWVEHVEDVDWNATPDDGSVGYILEVDLSYPEVVHDAHNSYPLAPERLAISDDILSPYCSELKSKLDIRCSKQEKLVPNLLPKTKYVVHYRNLKLYQSQGLMVTKVHRILQFRQSPWMKPYIEFNTRMRTQASTAFEKDLFKLLNNAVFGKTMENVRAYADVKLITSEAKFRKLAANPRYEYSTIFSEDLIGVRMKRASTCLCKPIYAGFSVLELSKELMYKFHYEYIVPKYGPRAQLLFTDTDSLCYHVETVNIYDDMLADCHLFDTSDYPTDHRLKSDANKKVLGKMKDETSGSPISEFCGLRSKMYSLMCEGIEKKRAKGIKKAVVKKVISHSDYVNTLFGETFTNHAMNLIRSEKHALYSMT